MPVLLKYAHTTGQILGVWESNNRDLLDAQRVEGDPVYGYLLVEEPFTASTVEQDYYVVDGALVFRPRN